MENPRLHRINNSRFTVRLCRISAKYHIKTVGKLYEFFKENPIIRYGGIFDAHPFRTEKLLKELEAYINDADYRYDCNHWLTKEEKDYYLYKNR